MDSTIWGAVIGAAAAIIAAIIGAMAVAKKKKDPSPEETGDNDDIKPPLINPPVPTDLSSITKFIEFDIPARSIRDQKVSSSELFTESNGVICSTHFSREYSNYIFVYGSLLVPKSLLRTIVRNRDSVEYIPARINNYKLGWGVPSKRVNLIDGKWHGISTEILWESLILQKGGANDCVEGALVGVYHAELEELRAREGKYILRKTNHGEIELVGGGYKTALIFEPREKAVQQDPVSNQHPKQNISAIRQGYFESINTALSALGFEKTLPAPHHENIISAFDADCLAEYYWRCFEDKIPEFETKLPSIFKLNTPIGEREYFIPRTVRPLIIEKSLYKEIQKVAESAVSLSSKGLQLLLNNPTCSELCGHCDKDVDLAKQDLFNNIERPDIARVDLTFFKGKLQVFEVNSDSPGGMFHIDYLSKRQAEFCRDLNLKGFDTSMQQDTSEAVRKILLRRWKEFTEKSARNNGEFPRLIVIMDRKPEAWNTYPEFQHFAELLKDNHTDVIIADPRKLEFCEKDQRLKFNGRPVDLIYKRILAVDLERPEMQEAERILRRAYELNSVCMVNSLGSRMTGCKYILTQIGNEDFEDKLSEINIELTDTERDVRKNNIPWSEPWHTDEQLRAEVISKPKEYVLKSYKGFGSNEVYIGENLKNADDVFNERWDKQYIVQERLRHGRARVPIPTTNGYEWEYRYYT